MRQVQEIDFLFFLRNFRRHWYIILPVGIFSAIAVFFVCYLWIAPTYKAKISLFAWGDVKDSPKELHCSQENVEQQREMTYQDITFGTQLVNDYRELLDSCYIDNKVQDLLDNELPELKDIPYHFETFIPNKTRFIKVFVYSHSARKATRASEIIAEVFMESVKEFMGVKRVQVVDLPQKVVQVGPKTPLSTVLAFLLGAGFVLFLYCLYDFFHHTLDNPSIVKDELELPTIGTIGLCDDAKNIKTICKRDKKDGYRYNHTVEDFLLLQTNLIYSLPKKDTAQIITLTSAFPHEGKSFSSLNLAFTLSENMKRVLLINCDLRKNEYDYLNLPRHLGLVNFLLGEKTIKEVIYKDVLGTGLSVIRNGPIPPNPTRILELFQESNILQELSKDYDYIILDSPPCMNMADPLLLSKLADGTIIVADSHRTPVEAVRLVKEQLQKVDINLLGVLLNRYLVRKSNYGYGYGYGYGENSKPSKKKHKKGE